MPTVIATVGAANANSYVTVAEANSYFGESFGKEAWFQTSTSSRESLVISASRALDLYITWMGDKVDQAQGMEWPRVDAFDKTGRRYAEDIIPSPVKFATYELAFYMLTNNGLSFLDQTVDSVKVGSIEVDFSKNSVDAGIPAFIENLISHIGDPVVPDGGSIHVARLVRS